MDKAKKMAEQAQPKIYDAQQQFNSSPQSEQASGPVVEYDSHGRPVAQAPAAPPHGDPLAEQAESSPPPTPGLPATAPGEGSPAAPPAADAPDAPSARPEADAADEDRNNPSYAPPKLTSGDPLAG